MQHHIQALKKEVRKGKQSKTNRCEFCRILRKKKMKSLPLSYHYASQHSSKVLWRCSLVYYTVAQAVITDGIRESLQHFPVRGYWANCGNTMRDLHFLKCPWSIALVNHSACIFRSNKTHVVFKQVFKQQMKKNKLSSKFLFSPLW